MNQSGKVILLVEDSRFLRIMNERALTRAGYSILTASDGEEALGLAKSRHPDLIVLDMLLPKVGGPEVLRQLKKDEHTSQIPVIVLSSLPQTNERRLKKDGAAAYFDKGSLGLHHDGDALVRAINNLLDPPADVCNSAMAEVAAHAIGSAKG